MLKVFPTPFLERSIQAPSSKSHTLRSILLASLAKGISSIHSYLTSPDTDAMVAACRSFGAQIEMQESEMHIIGCAGVVDFVEDTINAGNSGQVFRFIAAISAVGEKKISFSGDFSIQNRRPIYPLLQSLKALGVQIRTNPIQIMGPVKKYRTLIQGEDSQPVSGLIFLGMLLDSPLEIIVQHPGETPWIDVTLHWLDRVGVSYERNGYEQYVIYGKKGWDGFEYRIPGDWSSISFFVIGALISQKKLTIENIDYEDIQGDKSIIPILKQMGAIFEIQKNRIIVFPSGKLKGIEIDMQQCIDAVPVFSVLGCFLSSKLILKNVRIARFKESDRLKAISKELRKMKAHIEEYEDQLIIYPSSLHGAEVCSHGDHRIAMALTIAAIHANGATVLKGERCVEKSYPNFFQEIRNLGVNIEQLDFDWV